VLKDQACWYLMHSVFTQDASQRSGLTLHGAQSQGGQTVRVSNASTYRPDADLLDDEAGACGASCALTAHTARTRVRSDEERGRKYRPCAKRGWFYLYPSAACDVVCAEEGGTQPNATQRMSTGTFSATGSQPQDRTVVLFDGGGGVVGDDEGFSRGLLI
jgi:hypothetical protein